METLLIVDDELQLLNLMTSYLERLGYQLVSCSSATDALARFEAEPERFSVLVTDLSLTPVEGHELGMRMLERNPGLRVLLCTGHLFDLESLPEGVRDHIAGSELVMLDATGHCPNLSAPDQVIAAIRAFV